MKNSSYGAGRFWQQFRLVRPVQRNFRMEQIHRISSGQPERKLQQTQMKAKGKCKWQCRWRTWQTLVFYPNTYKFNVTGAGTQNTNPVEEMSDGHHYTGVFLSNRRKAIFTGNGNRFCKGIYTKVERAYNIYLSREKNIQEVYGRKTMLYNLWDISSMQLR